jgi:REP element-mobilizing transposase RayT
MSRRKHYRRKNSLRHPRVDYRSHGAYFVTINTYRRRHLFGQIVGGVMRCSPAGDIVWEEWRRTEALRADVVLDAFVVMPDHVHGIICIVPEGLEDVSPRGYRWAPHVPVHLLTRESYADREDDPDPQVSSPPSSKTDAETSPSTTRTGSTGRAKARKRQAASRCRKSGARSIRAEQYDPERDGVAYRPPRSLSSIVAGFKGSVTRRIRAECDIAPDARVWHRNFHDHVLRNERSWRAVRRYIRLNPQRWWQKYG